MDGMNSPRNAFNLDNLEGGGAGNNQKQEEHKIHILAYVDYSKKYGLGYLVNNKQYGVYFNDETLMSTDSENKNIFFIDNPASKQEKINSYPIDNLPKERDFLKKYMLLQRFIVHLNDEAAKLP